MADQLKPCPFCGSTKVLDIATAIGWIAIVAAGLGLLMMGLARWRDRRVDDYWKGTLRSGAQYMCGVDRRVEHFLDGMSNHVPNSHLRDRWIQETEKKAAVAEGGES